MDFPFIMCCLISCEMESSAYQLLFHDSKMMFLATLDFLHCLKSKFTVWSDTIVKEEAASGTVEADSKRKDPNGLPAIIITIN